MELLPVQRTRGGQSVILPDAMSSAVQARELDAKGYYLASGVLDEEWLELLKLAFASSTQQTDGTQHVRLTPETPGLQAWRELERVAIVRSAAEHILQRAFIVRDLHGRNPLPGFGQQGLHIDGIPWAAGDPATTVTALWMIDDFTALNGATRVVPGSHRGPGSVPSSFAQPHARHPDERIITGNAGDVLVFNGRLCLALRPSQRVPHRAASRADGHNGTVESSSPVTRALLRPRCIALAPPLVRSPRRVGTFPIAPTLKLAQARPPAWLAELAERLTCALAICL